MTNGDHLNGWKEIAAYLGKSTRAAQRWESDLAMPVRRLRTAKGGEIVYALKSELEQWKLDAGARRDTEPASSDAAVADDAIEAAESIAPATDPAAPGPGARTDWRWYAGAVATALVVAVITLGLTRFSRMSGTAADREWTHAVLNGADAPSGLDPGPWPTQSHDSLHTNHTHFAGPPRAPAVRKLFEAGTGGYASLAVLSNGNVLVGACGTVTAIDLQGGVRWRQRLNRRGFDEEPTGFTVDANGRVYFSTCECPDQLDAIRLGTYALLATGEIYWHRQHLSAHMAPTVGPDGSVYVLDETGTVHAYAADGNQRWVTDLPGYGAGLITLDRNGSLLIGNDGGIYNMSSLWRLNARDGRVLQNSGGGSLMTPLVVQDAILTADQRGKVIKFDPAGREVWSVEVAGTMNTESLSIGRLAAYAGASRSIVALDSTGRRLWQHNARQSNRPMAPLVDRNEDLYAFDDQSVYSLSSAGAERWKVTLPGVERLVFAGDDKLFAFARGNLFTLTSKTNP